MDKIKYYINVKRLDNALLEWIEVKPMSTIVISGNKHELPRRDYEIELNGSITFAENDYIRIKNHFDNLNCTDIEFEIKEYCSGNYNTVIFKGKLQNHEGSFDLDSCLANLDVESFDKYKCLEDNWETEIPFTSMSAIPQTINAMPYVNRYKVVWDMKTNRTPIDVIKLYRLQNSSITYDGIIADISDEVGSNSNQTSIYNLLARKTSSLLSPYYDDVSNSHAIRYRQEIGIGTIFTNNIKTYIIYEFPNDVYMVSKQTYQRFHTTIGENINTWGWSFEGLEQSYNSISNGRKIQQCLGDLLSRYCGGITLKSDFFQWNPSVVSLVNYVTLQQNYLTNLMIFQKSDVKRPYAPNRATGKSTNLSIKMLLEALCTMFNCNYYLTDSNQLVIEHMSWLGWQALMGFAPLRDISNTWGAGGRNYFTYKNANIPKAEEFKFMEAFNPDFVGKNITYPSGCVNNDDTIIYTADRITTDLTPVLYGVSSMYSNVDLGNNPTDKEISAEKDRLISDDGFMIIACRNEVANRVWVINGILTGGYPAPKALPNNPLSWAVLQVSYYRHSRYYKEATINDITYLSLPMVKYNAEIPNLSVINCCNSFKYLATYKTEIANIGEVESFEHDVESGMVNFNLSILK